LPVSQLRASRAASRPFASRCRLRSERSRTSPVSSKKAWRWRENDLHLPGRVVDPPDLSCSQEELLFFQLEHEELQQLPFAPQHGGHVVKYMVVLLSKRHMA